MHEQAKPYYQQSSEEVLKNLEVDTQAGLTTEKILERRDRYGDNSFERGKKKTLFDTFVSQVRNPLVYILFAALIATLFLGEYLDAVVITIAIGINTVIGIFQEGRASRAFEKLSNSQEKESEVLRNGKHVVIPSKELVPGDLVTVTSGFNIPADLRLIEAHNLKVDESSLTGESRSVSKSTASISKTAEVTDQSNMAFMGTLAVAGSAVGVVTGIGNETEIGKVAKSLASLEDTKTPIQNNIDSIANLLAKGAAIILAFVVLLGLLQGRALGETVLVSIAIAVSILPEGLPASVTVVLAIGMEAILKKGGLVKNLLAAETLGSTTVILTDKTGTLTQSKMSVTTLITADTLEANSGSSNLIETGDQKELLITSIRASDASITQEEGESIIKGRPIEKALLKAGIQHDLISDALNEENRRIDSLAFESKNRFGASLNNSHNNSEVLYISGAPELLLNNAKSALIGGQVNELTPRLKEDFLKKLKQASSEGMRFIGVSRRRSSRDEVNSHREEHTNKLLEGATFVGFIGFKDPIREDVPAAVRTAQEAGTHIIMLTGDLPGTAKSIAIEAGIATPEDSVVLGKDTVDMSDEELLETLKNTPVFARVLPDQKLRISEILKQDNEIVAMTGDGINDAPALRNSNIGVAVGSGTEVAKAASDLILLNDSFAIIIAAISEGRRIISNLKKIISYMLSTNLGECIALVGALVLALPIPLLPTQILWVNIIGEGLLNFALAFEPAEKGVMKRSPRRKHMRTVLTPDVKKLILIVGISTGSILMFLYYALLQTATPIEDIRTIMFITLSLGTTLYAFSFKSLTRSLFRVNPLSNPYLLVSLVVNFGLLYLSLTNPFLQTLLALAPLSVTIVGVAAAAGVTNLLAIELGKLLVFKQNRREVAAVIQ